MKFKIFWLKKSIIFYFFVAYSKRGPEIKILLRSSLEDRIDLRNVACFAVIAFLEEKLKFSQVTMASRDMLKIWYIMPSQYGLLNGEHEIVHFI